MNRIVIFRKKSVQAMIEFDSILGAKRAKAALNGVDIYRGCCTIKGQIFILNSDNLYHKNCIFALSIILLCTFFLQIDRFL